MHRHDCFTGPCTDISCAARGYSVLIVRMEDTQCESAEDTDAKQLANAQLYHQTSRVGEGACLLQQLLIVWLKSVSSRNTTELRTVLRSSLRSCRASALTRRDAVCQRPRKCIDNVVLTK